MKIPLQIFVAGGRCIHPPLSLPNEEQHFFSKDYNKLTLKETRRVNRLEAELEFEPWLKSAKNRFQLSAGLNLEKLNTILSGTNHI